MQADESARSDALVSPSVSYHTRREVELAVSTLPWINCSYMNRLALLIGYNAIIDYINNTSRHTSSTSIPGRATINKTKYFVYVLQPKTVNLVIFDRGSARSCS